MGLPAPQALQEVGTPAPTPEPLSGPEGQSLRSPSHPSSHIHMAGGRSGGRRISGREPRVQDSGWWKFLLPRPSLSISRTATAASQAPLWASPLPGQPLSSHPSHPPISQDRSGFFLFSRHSATGLREHRRGAQPAPQAARVLHPGLPHPIPPALPPE